VHADAAPGEWRDSGDMSTHRISTLLGVALVALAAAGCGSGASSSTPAAQTPAATAPPQTTTPPPPQTHSAPRPALADGVHFVVLHGFTAAEHGYTAVVDRARYLVGSESASRICLAGGGTEAQCTPGHAQERRCEAAGGGNVDPEDGRCWNDYYVDNPVHHLVRVHVAAWAPLLLHLSPGSPERHGDLATFARLARREHGYGLLYSAIRPPHGLLWVTVHNGTITRISQQFVS
jgi:hypothetical protein